MKILKQLHNLSDVGKSKKELQTEISTSESWHLWDMLRARYDVINQTNIYLNFVTDKDFLVVLNIGLNQLKEQIIELEKATKKYGITVPGKNPVPPNITHKIAEINDQYIFRNILQGIQGFLQIHLSSFVQSTNPAIRQLFKELFISEIGIYDKLLEYGKIKNWVDDPPTYRI